MSGIIKSMRLVTVKALCGHDVLIEMPPGEISKVGKARIQQAETQTCYDCRQK